MKSNNQFRDLIINNKLLNLSINYKELIQVLKIHIFHFLFLKKIQLKIVIPNNQLIQELENQDLVYKC